MGALFGQEQAEIKPAGCTQKPLDSLLWWIIRKSFERGEREFRVRYPDGGGFTVRLRQNNLIKPDGRG